MNPWWDKDLILFRPVCSSKCPPRPPPLSSSVLLPRGWGRWLSAAGCHFPSAAVPSPCSRRSSRSWCSPRTRWSQGTAETEAQNEMRREATAGETTVRWRSGWPFCLFITFVCECSVSCSILRISDNFTQASLKIHLASAPTLLWPRYYWLRIRMFRFFFFMN